MNEIYKKRRDYIDDYCGGIIMDAYNSPRFSEFTINRGGDVCVYRVYGDNETAFMVTAR